MGKQVIRWMNTKLLKQASVCLKRQQFPIINAHCAPASNNIKAFDTRECNPVSMAKDHLSQMRSERSASYSVPTLGPLLDGGFRVTEV